MQVKKLVAFLFTAFLPFIMVWTAFILTAFNFNPRIVFDSGMFWGLSMIYWLIWTCMLGFIVEAINDIF